MRRLLVLSLLLTGFSVQAASVSVRITGTLTDFSDPDSLLPFGSLIVGITQFTMLLHLDLGVPDLAGADPVFGVYPNAVQQTSLSANGSTVNGTGSAPIVVANDQLNPDTGDFSDSLVIHSGNAPNEAVFVLVLVNVASTSPAPPLTTDELVLPFDSPDWPNKNIYVSIFDEILDPDIPAVRLASASVLVDSIQVVPIPAAAWLFGSALGLLVWMRRTTA